MVVTTSVHGIRWNALLIPIFWGATYVGQNKRNLLEIWLLLDGILVGSNYELLKFGS